MLHYKYIAIEGNIGAGKTTLAQRLASYLHAQLVLESFAENPYLPLFYENKAQHALPLELSFLSDRFEQMQEVSKDISTKNQLLVSDYIFQKTSIFAEVNLNNIEFELYKKIAHQFNAQLPQPDLLIFLEAPTTLLLSNIKKRGRSYEQQIDAEYLDKISTSYQSLLSKIPQEKILKIEMTQVDFNSESDFKQLISQLENHQ